MRRNIAKWRHGLTNGHGSGPQKFALVALKEMVTLGVRVCNREFMFAMYGSNYAKEGP